VEDSTLSLENNWGMPLLWPGLETASLPYVQCLQGGGPFLPHPVCKHSRPSSGLLGPANPQKLPNPFNAW